MSEDADAPEGTGDDETGADRPETDVTDGTDGTDESTRTDPSDRPAGDAATGDETTDDTTAGGDATDDSGGVSPARDMTVNVGIVTALVITPLLWVLLEGVLTLFGHHPGTWQLRLVTVGAMNLAFWVALGIDESRDDDWVGLAAVGWLLALLPLWVLVEVAVMVLGLSSLAGLEQSYLRLGISVLSALFLGILLDRRRE